MMGDWGMTKLAKHLCGAAAGLIGLSAASGAFAGVTPSDVMTVFDGSHDIVDQQVVFELDEDPTNIITSTVAIDPSQFGNATVLIEPGTGQPSDIVGVCACGVGGALMLGFESDGDPGPVFVPGAFPRTFVEAKKPVDITLYLAPALQAQGWTATFSSDLEVPEPATWALMLVGLGAIGYAARSRRPARTA
jgi:hypothetical protein